MAPFSLFAGQLERGEPGGVDLEATNANGCTALIQAAECGHAEVVR